ncbi:MAG: ribosomal protein S18-alanine N-acetyltransferase [Desulfovibrionales bacterium]
MKEVFVRLGVEDLTALLELEIQCFTCPWTREQFLLGLQQKAFHLFGLKKDGVLVAYISFYTVEEDMEILNIGVHPRWRRRGFADRLLKLVLQICAGMGIKQSFLEVRESNAAAQKLYRNHGYTPCGRRRGYYPDNGEDAIVMQKDIHTEPTN